MKKLFWISWYQPTEDYRPLTYPPNENVLSWHCTGSNSSEDIYTICSMVKAENEEEAKKTIQLDWPEAEEWRFCKIKESTELNDRFPLDDWMKKRIEKFNEEEKTK